ncbi:MAG: ATP-grasp fold amidoligase family protein [Pseudomonadota bacterium]
MSFMGKLQRYFPLVSVSSSALSHATAEIHTVYQRYADQIDRPPKPDHLRGVDYYDPDDLRYAIARGADIFRKAHGVMPSLSDPKTYNEKLFWMKVFCDIPQPSPGNKLAVGNFVPSRVAHLVSPIKPVWLSDEISLPRNEDVPPGNYFFKANYGSGCQLRLAFPISENTRRRALSQARRWPRRRDVEGLGEWWYHTYPKEYFLEPSVSDAGSPNEFQFTVLGGRIGFVQHIRGRFESCQRNLYDRNFQPLKLNIDSTAQGEFIAAPAEFAAMCKVAEAIGSQFRYARVDLFLLENGDLKLNGITLCPGNCSGVFDDPAFDRRIADMAQNLTFAR